MSCNFDANYSLKKREVEPWNFTICKPKQQRKEKLAGILLICYKVQIHAFVVDHKNLKKKSPFAFCHELQL